MVAQPVMAQQSRSRRLRRPQHPFYIRQVPYAIHPFLVAPVLPGETMKNLMFQSRAVTEPLDNPLIGWWMEYYFFYVKIRDIQEVDLTEMFLDPSYDTSAVTTAQGGTTASAFYFYGGGAATVNWSRLLLRRVVEEFFRETDGTWNSPSLTVDTETLPIAGIQQESWMDSLTLDDSFTAVDINVDLNANATITAGEVIEATRRYQMERLFGPLTNMTFEDYLRSNGVRAKLTQEEDSKPELIRFVREWTYPTNTIDPTNGTPRSACSWSIGERADKDRMFPEPGFIFGVTVCRPKVYLTGQTGSAAAMMNALRAWVPAMFKDDPFASYVQAPASGGPTPVITDAQGYWYDIRDLLEYGDQYRYLPTSEGHHEVALPTSTGSRRYVPTAATITDMFVTARTDLDYVRQDGVVSLNIATHSRDPEQTFPVSLGGRSP